MTTKPNEKFELSGDFVGDGFRLAKMISLMGREMRGLAMAFEATGNNKVSDQLFNIYLECEIYDEGLRNLVASETQRGVNEAQKLSGVILTACLAKANTTRQ